MGTKITAEMRKKRAAHKAAVAKRKAAAKRPTGAGARRDKKLSAAEKKALNLKKRK